VWQLLLAEVAVAAVRQRQTRRQSPVAKDDTKSVTENGRLEGTVPSATDADGIVVRYELVGKMADSDGILIFNSNGTYKFWPSSFDYLAEGEKATVAFRYVAVDNNGVKSDPKTVTIVVTGTNDIPDIVAMETVGKSDSFTVLITETDKGISVKSTLTIQDKDLSESVIFKTGATKVNFEGTTFMDINQDQLPEFFDFAMDLLTLTTESGNLVNQPHNLTWNFEYTDEQAFVFDLIPEGETLMINYTIEINDPHGAVANKVVSVSIAGKDDAPEVSVRPEEDSASGTVVDAKENVIGSLTVLDADISPNVTPYIIDVKLNGGSIANTNTKNSLYDSLLFNNLTSTFQTVSENSNFDWIFNTEKAFKTDFEDGLEKGSHELTYSLIFAGVNFDDGYKQDIVINFNIL
jgi:VCBS repeat-containing protein